MFFVNNKKKTTGEFMYFVACFRHGFNTNARLRFAKNFIEKLCSSHRRRYQETIKYQDIDCIPPIRVHDHTYYEFIQLGVSYLYSTMGQQYMNYDYSDQVNVYEQLRKGPCFNKLMMQVIKNRTSLLYKYVRSGICLADINNFGRQLISNALSYA